MSLMLFSSEWIALFQINFHFIYFANFLVPYLCLIVVMKFLFSFLLCENYCSQKKVLSKIYMKFSALQLSVDVSLDYFLIFVLKGILIFPLALLNNMVLKVFTKVLKQVNVLFVNIKFSVDVYCIVKSTFESFILTIII